MIRKIGANQYGVVEYAVSTEEEVAKLPHLIGQGSTCIVIATGNVYMFDEGDTSWHSLVDGSVVVPEVLRPKEVMTLCEAPIEQEEQQVAEKKQSKKLAKKVK